MRPRLLARGLTVIAFVSTFLLTSATNPAQSTDAFDPSRLVLRQMFPETVFGPLGVANAGDGTGRLFILDQSGKVWVVKDGLLLGTPFLDLSSLIAFTVPSEQGLLGLAFHPNYATNRQFYVAYTAASTGALTLARYLTDASTPDIADPLSATVLLSVPHPDHTSHNGGMLAFGPVDGYLYWTTGDGGEPDTNPQNLNSRLGKILRIDVDHQDPGLEYAIPAGNPFVESPLDDPSTLPEIWAHGLRNPWRLSFDRLTADLWIGDVGQNLYEEVDFQPAHSTGGENYGWDILEADHCYNAGTCTPPVSYVAPVVEIPHTLVSPRDNSCAVIGGYRYRGTRFPELQGQYFYGDECTGHIWSISGDPVGGWSWQLLPLLRDSLSSFGESESGEIFLTDWGNGRIWKFCYIAGAESCAADTLGIHSGDAFFLKNTLAGGDADLAFPYGWPGVTPLVGDWDGNATRTVGINSEGWFFLRNSNSAGEAELTFQYGWAGATPLVGDWDGDGTTTPGIFTDGWFFLRVRTSPGQRIWSSSTVGRERRRWWATGTGMARPP